MNSSAIAVVEVTTHAMSHFHTVFLYLFKIQIKHKLTPAILNKINHKKYDLSNECIGSPPPLQQYRYLSLEI